MLLNLMEVVTILNNKRGQVFSLILVFITLALCGIVIGLYFVQQGNAQASLVSPSDVLSLRDELSIFEMREVELIKSSLGSASGAFGSDEFKSSLRLSFIDGVIANEKMTGFLFEDLFVGGVEVRDQDKNRNLLEERIYLEGLVSGDKDGIVFGRSKIEKRRIMTAKNESRIDFPVYFTFEFDGRYLIGKNGEVTKV